MRDCSLKKKYRLSLGRWDFQINQYQIRETWFANYPTAFCGKKDLYEFKVRYSCILLHRYIGWGTLRKETLFRLILLRLEYA